MTRDEFPQFNRALAKLAVLFAKPVTPERITTYFESLSDISLPRVLAAITLAQQQEERFPLPGKLRQLAAIEAQRSTAPMPGLQPAPDVPDTVEAWLDAHDITFPADAWIDPKLESYRREAASCGQRPLCQTGECTEQVPVPFVAEIYNPARVTARYRACQHHAARCAIRAERRVQREQQNRRDRSAS